MPNTSVPANVTALPAADPFLDFEADDSGAMQHEILCDAYEEFLVTFKVLIATPFAAPEARLAAARPG